MQEEALSGVKKRKAADWAKPNQPRGGGSATAFCFSIGRPLRQERKHDSGIDTAKPLPPHSTAILLHLNILFFLYIFTLEQKRRDATPMNIHSCVGRIRSAPWHLFVVSPLTFWKYIVFLKQQWLRYRTCAYQLSNRQFFLKFS